MRNGDIQRKQFQLAMKGNVQMLNWLGKNWLNQRNNLEQVGDDPLTEYIRLVTKRSEEIDHPEGWVPAERTEDEK